MRWRADFRRLGMIAVLLLVAAGAAAPGPNPQTPPKPAASPPEAKPAEDDPYEMQRLLVDTLDQVQRNYVRPIPRKKLVEAAIKGVLTELDPYSSYIGPEEIDQFRSTVESEYGGVGIQPAVENGQLIVISPLVGSPAYRGGIVAGDRIVAIDGRDAAGLGLDDAMKLIRGKEGSRVSLTVIHPGQTARETIALVRQRIHVDTVLGHRRNPDDSWNYFLDAPKRIGYIRVTAFGRDTAGELRKAVEKLQTQRVRGLVLDLRFNPGGLLTAAVDVSKLFVVRGRIVSTAGRNSVERTWDADGSAVCANVPLVVLVNRYSASASEIVAACLQDHKRAIVVGERTWGKGSVQNVIPLIDGAGGAARSNSALKLTTAGYRRPSGKNIDRAAGAKDGDEWGVQPDKGYELKLDDRENQRLVRDSLERDIVRPKGAAAAEATAVATTASTGGGRRRASAQILLNARGESFVDRQLQMALAYLNTELARAR